MPAGSNVALTLVFLRFALLMNLVLLVLWLLLVVMPFWAKPPVTFRWNQISSYSVKLVIQGYGLDSSFIVYGEPLMLSRYGSSVCASHGNSGRNACCIHFSNVQLHTRRADRLGCSQVVTTTCTGMANLTRIWGSLTAISPFRQPWASPLPSWPCWSSR